MALTTTTTAASAAPEPRAEIQVTQVKLIDKRLTARVKITVKCEPPATRDLLVIKVNQYGTPTSGPSGTRYEAAETIGLVTCTGKAQAFTVVLTPGQGQTGLLSRGVASLIIGAWYSEGYPEVSNQYVVIK